MALCGLPDKTDRVRSSTTRKVYFLIAIDPGYRAVGLVTMGKGNMFRQENFSIVALRIRRKIPRQGFREMLNSRRKGFASAEVITVMCTQVGTKGAGPRSNRYMCFDNAKPPGNGNTISLGCNLRFLNTAVGAAVGAAVAAWDDRQS